MTEGPAVQSGHLSITGLPLELIRLILDRVYEDPSTLVVTKSLRSPLQTVTGLPINILLVNHFIRSEALSAIRRSRQNTIDLKLYATLPDVTAQLTSPSAFSFLSSVTTLSLTDFRYESSTLKLWKTICPKLGNVRISHAYSPTASASVHRCMIVRNFPSLLHGDADELFATTAVERILAVHPTFCLSDLRGLNLTFSNVIDFWSHEWGPEWYHENRVLVSLPILASFYNPSTLQIKSE